MSEFLELRHRFSFESAHFLPNLPPEHKCRRLHGHSFQAEVIVAGPLDQRLGWVIDYADIKAAVEPIRIALDHTLLNDIAGLENPTSERIAMWIWQRLRPIVRQLTAVHIHETCNNSCIYRGPQ
jgi:6-pyruvoyltetrahydropterin/6-carboxytetrahydropterin synthase